VVLVGIFLEVHVFREENACLLRKCLLLHVPIAGLGERKRIDGVVVFKHNQVTLYLTVVEELVSGAIL